MDSSLKIFRDKYLDILLRFLWREWTALGISGQEKASLHHVIDLEALLLFTCYLGRYDPRLFDEVIDWLTVNGRFLNIQRMKNILRRELFHGGKVLSAVADWLSHHENPMKWKLLANSTARSREHRSLFFLTDGRPLPEVNDNDAIFLEHGYLRNTVSLRGYSQAFPSNTMPCHLVKLRALFGVNIRCDILAYLTMNKSGHPREIAREMYYSQKAIHDVMTDMACSGVIQSAKLGRERTFRISSSSLPLLTGGMDLPGWINWPILLSAAESVWKLVDEISKADLDPLVESSEVRAKITPLLKRLIQTSWCPTLPYLQNQESYFLLDAFKSALELLYI